MEASHDPNRVPTCAIVFGASEYPFQEQSFSKPQFKSSAEAAKRYFESSRGLNIPTSELLDLFDSADHAADQLAAIGEFLDARRGYRAFVYYIGHGAFNAQDYYLAARNLRTKLEPQTGFLSRSLADHVRTIPNYGGQLFLILDACFAAKIFESMQTQSARDIERKAAAKTLESLQVSGVALLAATSKDDPAKTDDTLAMTLFSKCFLDTLWEGIPGGRSSLSLAEVCAETRRRIPLVDPKYFGLPESHAPKRMSVDLTALPVFKNNHPAAEDDSGHEPLPEYRSAEVRISTMALPEEVYLLGFPPRTDPISRFEDFHERLTLAAVAEFLLAGRVRWNNSAQALEIVSREPIEDPILDHTFSAFVKTLEAHGERLAIHETHRVLEAGAVQGRLTDLGVLRLQIGRAWPFGRIRSYAVVDEKSVMDFRERFSAAVEFHEEMPDRLAALAAVSTFVMPKPRLPPSPLMFGSVLDIVYDALTGDGAGSRPPDGISEVTWRTARSNALESEVGRILFRVMTALYKFRR